MTLVSSELLWVWCYRWLNVLCLGRATSALVLGELLQLWYWVSYFSSDIEWATSALVLSLCRARFSDPYLDSAPRCPYSASPWCWGKYWILSYVLSDVPFTFKMEKSFSPSVPGWTAVLLLSHPWGQVGRSAFGSVPCFPASQHCRTCRSFMLRAIILLGEGNSVVLSYSRDAV